MARHRCSSAFAALALALLCVVCPVLGALPGLGLLQRPQRQHEAPGRRLVTPIHAPKLAYANAVSEIEDLMASTVPDVLESVKDFMMGAVAGAMSSFSVFPIDLAKTRMQDQRVVAGAEMVYKNTFQTLRKVLAEEGLPALYGGVIPVVIGSAPEAALQLGGDVAARKFFAGKLGKEPGEQLPMWAEVASGSFAGISQVLASNPMERVKILQQVGAKGSVLEISKTLGIRGLYQVGAVGPMPLREEGMPIDGFLAQGWYATALRDVPFGAIYFTTYSRVKSALIDASRKSVKRDKRGKIVGGSTIVSRRSATRDTFAQVCGCSPLSFSVCTLKNDPTRPD